MISGVLFPLTTYMYTCTVIECNPCALFYCPQAAIMGWSAVKAVKVSSRGASASSLGMLVVVLKTVLLPNIIEIVVNTAACRNVWPWAWNPKVIMVIVMFVPLCVGWYSLFSFFDFYNIYIYIYMYMLLQNVILWFSLHHAYPLISNNYEHTAWCA